MNMLAGHKRELEDDNQSANFKKLKSDLGALFGLGGNSLLNQHNTVVSFRELTLLDDNACTKFVEILKTHGYHKVKDMPPEFVNACGNLYSSCKTFFSSDETFKQTRFPEKESDTGYKRSKDRESVYFRKGYHLDDAPTTTPRGLIAMDPARDLQSRFEQYYAEASKAAHVLLQAVVKGLGGAPEQARSIIPFSHEHNTLSTNVARAFHYADTPVHTVICPPHIDIGLLTLIPSNFPGLQVYSLCGSCGLGWESTHKSLDSSDLVVLAGECLNEFAGGVLPPGLHRVVSEKPPPIVFPAFSFGSPFAPSTPPTPPTTTTPPPAKKSRSRKAAKEDAAAAQNADSAGSTASGSSAVGRISIPFALRARADVKLDGTLLGLKPTRRADKTVGAFVEEEKAKKGSAGQY